MLNTERKPHKSWVVCSEGGKYPNVIVELLSNSTANIDRTEKKRIDQEIFRTPEYFWYFDSAQYQHRAESRCWFSPETLEFLGFHLLNGEYEDLQPNEQGWFWSKQCD